ncbi:polysaccharide biosynthesis protein [Chloroherpeton thalassium ATCC 35110]|uniref:Polysaccharide biosynthesis protein n=1 Tax=Chloroherpeton thalassium (strain ATCC 35110 / GB-78) TaxID=517418 RepID=B3QU57_CHLT3|nr:oligosaccharide flippase family protein [Chloroherpeton thalassium]ACF12855.1 polysaccharide biosynthesis protein [Chloroherpeton thalassium ATCC 35110]
MLNYRKIAWTLINNSLEILIGLGSIVLVTRLYTPEDVGAWSVFTALFFFVTKIREGIVQTALVKYSAGIDGESYWTVLKSSFWINLAIEVAICMTISTSGALGFFPLLSALLMIYPVYSVGWSIYRWMLFVFQSRLEVELIFRMNLIIVSVLGVGFGLLVRQAWPLWAMVLVLGSASGLAAVYGTWRLGIKNLLQAKAQRQMVKDLLAFGKYGLLREIAGTLSTRINVFLTAGLLTFAEAGLLGVAQRFTQLVLIPNAAIQTLIFPKACELNNQAKNRDLKTLYETSVAMLLGMFLPMVAVIALFAEQIILLFNGSAYLAAAPLLTVMVITVALYSPFGNAFGSVINAISKPEINVMVVTVNSVINIALSVTLISTVGLYGAVIAPFLTETFGFFWIGILLKKELDISFLRCFLLIPKSYQNLYVAVRQKLSPGRTGT